MLTMSVTENTYGLQDDILVRPLVDEAERTKKGTRNILRYFRLRQYIQQAACDAFVVMLPITTILLLSLKRIIKAPVIAAERCSPAAYSGMKRFLLRKLARKADAWVFQTDDAKKWYGNRIRQGEVIPNAINQDFLREPYTGEREKTIAAAGRFTAQKNFSLLLDAFGAVADQYPEYRLVIYGKGPQEQMLREKAETVGLADRVEFPGYVENMAEELEKAGMFVLSSDFEGMPNALMEAMALGLPCISTDCPCGGPAFLIRNGENGLLIPVGDAAAMAKALSELLQSPEKAAALGQNAREITQTLAPEKIYARWEAYICRIAEEKKKHS